MFACVTATHPHRVVLPGKRLNTALEPGISRPQARPASQQLAARCGNRPPILQRAHMHRSARRPALVPRFAVWSSLALVLLLLTAMWGRDWSQQSAPRDAMRRAEASGAYHFAADVSQKTIPLPSIVSV